MEVIKANTQITLPNYGFKFAIYGGNKDFNNPYEVLVFNNSVYVSDYNNKRIGVYDLNGKHIKDIVTGGMNGPAGMAWDGNRLYVANPQTSQIFVMDANGSVLDRIKLDPKIMPSDMALDGNFLYILNNRSMTVEKYDLNAKKVVKSFGGYGNEDGKMYYPYGLAVRDGKVYIADSLNNRINVYDLEGKYLQRLPKDVDGQKVSLSVPHGISFDKGGLLYTVEGLGGRVSAIDQNGQIVLQVSKSQQLSEDNVQDIALPADVTFDSQGRMYVLEHSFKRVLVYSLQ